jgi:hypothetical protein
VSAIQMSWQTETGQLACRWSEALERVQYNPHWMQDASAIFPGAPPAFLDFQRHSPFAGAKWYAPRNSCQERALQEALRDDVLKRLR